MKWIFSFVLVNQFSILVHITLAFWEAVAQELQQVLDGNHHIPHHVFMQKSRLLTTDLYCYLVICISCLIHLVRQFQRDNLELYKLQQLSDMK